MKLDAPEITVVTDISANVFSVFLLILIILLAMRQQNPVPAASPPAVVDVEADLVSVDRVPLSPADMVTLLYDRREAAQTIRIDLLEDRIDVVAPSGTRRLALSGAPTSAGLPTLQPGLPIGLYVFSPRGYALTVAALRRAGRNWHEISVPAALRNPKSPGSGWSTEFAALLGRAEDLPRFRVDLARLLASPRPAAAPPLGGPGGRGKGLPDDAGAPQRVQPSSLLDQVKAWLRAALTLIALGSAVAFMARVEWLTYRRRRAAGGAPG